MKDQKKLISALIKVGEQAAAIKDSNVSDGAVDLVLSDLLTHLFEAEVILIQELRTDGILTVTNMATRLPTVLSGRAVFPMVPAGLLKVIIKKLRHDTQILNA